MKNTARFLKALSEEPRLRILAMLMEMEAEVCVCDLMAVLKLPQSTISRHLAYLRESGWVRGRKDGIWSYYRLAEMPGAFASELADLLKKRLPELPETRRDCATLDDFRQTQKMCPQPSQQTSIFAG